MKRLLPAALLLVLLAASVYAGLQSAAFDAFLTRRAPSWAWRLGIRLAVDRVDFDLWGPSLQVWGLRVAPADEKWSASVARASVRFHPLASLSGTPHLSVEADAPRVSVTSDLQGKTKFEVPKLVLDTVRVSRGAVVFAVPSRGLRVEVPEAEVHWVHGRGWGRLRGGSLRWKGADEPFGEAVFEGTRRFGILSVRRFSFASRRVQVAGLGTMGLKHLLQGRLTARLDARALPEAWVDAVGLRHYRPVQGAVTLSGAVSGRLEEPTFDGTVAVSAGRFGPLAFQGASLELGADRDGIRFRRLEARSSAGRARGVDGGLSWKKGVYLEARGQVLAYDLRPFMGLFVQGHFPVGLRASGSFQARGPLYPELALRCRLEAAGRDLDVTTVEEGQPTTWFSLPEGKVSAEGTVGAEALVLGRTRVDGGSIVVSIPSGRIDYATGLKLDTDVEITNLSLVRQYVPEGTEVRGRAVGHFGGPYDQLTFRYDLDLASTALWGTPLGRLRAGAEFDLRDLVVHKGVLEGPLGRLEAQGRATLRSGGALDLAVDWADGDLAAASGLLRHLSEQVPADLSGLASAVGRVGGTLESPTFEGAAAVVGAAAEGYAVDEARVSGRFGLSRWEAERLVARAYGAEVEASGEGDREFFQASGTVRGVTAAGLEPVLGRRVPVEGVLSAAVRAWGPYRSPNATAQGRLVGGAADGVALGDVEVTAEAKGPRISAAVSGFAGALAATARIDLEGERPFAADVKAVRLPWSVVPVRLVPEGLGAVSLSGHGSLEGAARASPVVAAARWTGVVAGARFRALSLGDVDVRAALSGEDLRFGLDAWAGEASVEGATAADGKGPVDLAVHLAGLDLARLEGLATIPRGRVSAELQGTIDLQGLQELEGAERLKAVAGLRSTGTVRGLVIPGWISFPDLTFEADSPAGGLRGTVRAPGATASFAVADLSRLSWTADLALDRLALAPLLPKGHALEGLAGLVTARVSARGEGGAVETAEGSGDAVDLAWGPVAPTRWHGAGSFARGIASFRLSEPRGVKADGTWSAPEGLRVSAVLEGTPLQGWTREGVAPSDLRGTASGAGELAWRAGEEVSARMRLRALDATLPPVTIRNQGELSITYAGGVVRFDAVHLVGDGFDLAVTGGLRPGESWDAKGKGRGDLAVLSRGVSGVRAASGSVVAEVSVSGPWKDPVVEGPVEILPGARVALDALDVPFEDIDARGSLEAGRGLVVEWVDAQFGEGRVHAEGFVGAQGLKPKELRLMVELRNIDYEAPPQVTYRFDGDVLVTGTAARPEVRGEVRLQHLLYARRVNWRTMVLDLIQRRPLEVQGAGTGGGVFVDLSLQGSQDLRVENNLADLSLAVDLRARGTLPRPSLWGRVELLDGTLKFRNQDYTVLRSTVEFLGEAQPVPLLDLHGRTTAGQYAVNVDVTGPLDGYQVLLSSSPPLSQTDLVSLLTVGTTSDQVQAADTVTAAEATSFLTGRIQDLLETEVGDLLGFEQFSIDTSYSPTAQSSMPRVTVGKAITQSLFAKYSAAVGEQSTQDVQLQYTVNPRLQLLGTWSDRGPSDKGSVGGEVRIRFTFR
ncbi:MAG: translocation/assembly module TamB [Deltaproteobacteria bacterium]|nr:translocation/assembly module TamB [Deltaproteobacteria bacterium]